MNTSKVQIPQTHCELTVNSVYRKKPIEKGHFWNMQLTMSSSSICILGGKVVLGNSCLKKVVTLQMPCAVRESSKTINYLPLVPVYELQKHINTWMILFLAISSSFIGRLPLYLKWQGICEHCEKKFYSSGLLCSCRDVKRLLGGENMINLHIFGVLLWIFWLLVSSWFGGRQTKRQPKIIVNDKEWGCEHHLQSRATAVYLQSMEASFLYGLLANFSSRQVSMHHHGYWNS